MSKFLSKLLLVILCVFSVIGIAYVYQRETAILANQDTIVKALIKHEQGLREIAQYLDQQRQQMSQKPPNPPSVRTANEAMAQKPKG